MASDISPEYLDTLRRMTGVQKLRAASLLYWGARKLKAARLKLLHPEWSEEEINRHVVKILQDAKS